jgi:hypothetical protein
LSDGDVDGFGAFFQVVERHAISLALAVYGSEWLGGVTGKVTAGVDPRSVPHESQAKIRAGTWATAQQFQ